MRVQGLTIWLGTGNWRYVRCVNNRRIRTTVQGIALRFVLLDTLLLLLVIQGWDRGMAAPWDLRNALITVHLGPWINIDRHFVNSSRKRFQREGNFLVKQNRRCTKRKIIVVFKRYFCFNKTRFSFYFRVKTASNVDRFLFRSQKIF